jgi:glycosyltransferase involved in cell wall biosynthesis
MQALPLVSIVIPLLNEIEMIERCIQSILVQDYPIDLIEIIAVDGMSRDGSRERVAEYALRYPNVKLLDNPLQRTPIALNIGVRKAIGSVIIILGAHTRIKYDFISINIHYMKKYNYYCVGGTQVNVGDTFFQRAAGYAMGSIFGIPSAPYRFLENDGFVDTVAYAAYNKELFEQVGYFDEEHIISEDAEFNWRIRRFGHKIFYTPKIVTFYYPRKTFGRLFKQFYNYGILRVNMFKKHSYSFKLFHLAPPVFVLFLVGLALLTLCGSLFSLLFVSLVLVYFLYLSVGAVYTCRNHESYDYLLIVPLLFIVMHISWGSGFWVGLFCNKQVNNQC